MANLESLELNGEELANSVSFLSGTDKFFVMLNISIDKDAECQRLKKDLEYYEGFLLTVNNKLNNKRFVQNAPEKVVALERKKLSDAETKIKSLKEDLKGLGC